MLTRTSEYALRALICMVRDFQDQPISGKRVAEQTGIPPRYLSKILRDLVHVGVLESSRGIKGGFRITRPAEEITLFDIVAPFEQFELRRCPFGNDQCGEDHPCLAHHQWKTVLETQQRFLESTSIYDVAVKRSARSKH